MLPLNLAFLCLETLLRLQFFATLVSADGQQQASVEYTKDDDFRDAVLNVSNTYRKQHNATSLSWNETLEKVAQDWSDGCEFKHSVCVGAFLTVIYMYAIQSSVTLSLCKELGILREWVLCTLLYCPALG